MTEENRNRLNAQWVKERAACSLVHMFERLTSEVESDVEMRNNSRPEERGYKFAFIRSGNTFSVVRESGPPNLIVKFALTSTAIVGTDGNGRTTFTATITLNDEGECKFKIDEKECDSWQLRRKALEGLFFE